MRWLASAIEIRQFQVEPRNCEVRAVLSGFFQCKRWNVYRRIYKQKYIRDRRLWLRLHFSGSVSKFVIEGERVCALSQVKHALVSGYISETSAYQFDIGYIVVNYATSMRSSFPHRYFSVNESYTTDCEVRY